MIFHFVEKLENFDNQKLIFPEVLMRKFGFEFVLAVPIP